MAAAVVADSGLDVLGQALDVGDELLDGLGLEVLFSFEGVVELGHVAVVMLAVMDLHGLGVDMRLQRVWWVGQVGEFEGHEKVSFRKA